MQKSVLQYIPSKQPNFERLRKMFNANIMNVSDYVKVGGNKCPHCQSHDIQAESPDFDGSQIYCDVVCNSCNATWTDVYRLDAYGNLDTSDCK